MNVPTGHNTQLYKMSQEDILKFAIDLGRFIRVIDNSLSENEVKNEVYKFLSSLYAFTELEDTETFFNRVWYGYTLEMNL